MSQTMELLCCCCGSPDWLACAPGSEAEAGEQGNLFVLHPEPEVPLQAWCAEHWPQRVVVQSDEITT